MTPLARRTDPATSHLAAKEAARSFAEGHKAKILATLARYADGLTYDEIARDCGLEPVQVHRRIASLVSAGSIERCGAARRSRVSGRPCETYRLRQAKATQGDMFARERLPD